jgi:hypothetical protein
MQKPDEERIPLSDAMHGRFARLVSRDEPMFQERGPSISVRINVSHSPTFNELVLTRCNTSGRVINPGVVRSLLEISAILPGPSHVPN